MFFCLVFLFCGFFIKLGIAPFHFWVPQIYDGAPNFITLILLTVPKFVLFIVFMKLYLFVFGFLNVFYIEVLWVLVILSFFFGSIGALWQNNVKRFLAYSSITNSGFILLSFSLFTYEGLYSGILYLVIYVFSTFGIFYIFLITRYQQSNSSAILDFKSFSTVRLINPTLSIMLSINLLSVAGIPPLSGFISKFFIFKSVIESDFSFILIPLIIFSLISAYYYIRPIKLFFFNEKPQPKFLAKIPYSAALIVTLIFYFNVCMIIQPRLLLLLIEMAISSSLI
ncbi:MAG: hypothetical protein CMP47_12110 [Rickettsiales bacterium]|nr:hypothetical protein [Rickettsiales bacterium]